jgi:cytochrome bd-type quinol oxidase subunit 1
MELSALLLSRLQFAFTISFHIIKERISDKRWMLWAIFLGFPLPWTFAAAFGTLAISFWP